MSAHVGECLHQILSDLMHEVTGLRVSAETTFEEIGLESLSVVSFTRRLAPFFPDLPQAFLFDCRTVAEVAAYLENHYPAQSQALVGNGRLSSGCAAAKGPNPQETEASDDWRELPPLPLMLPGSAAQQHDIAVVGMQGRFPNARDLSQFWRNLKRGVDSVVEIPPSRWTLDGFFAPAGSGRNIGRSYCKWGAFLDDVDLFDAKFFGIAPREALLMDPQERLFLQTSWQAMESACLLGERAGCLKGPGGFDVGVFLGLTTNTYLLQGPDLWRRGHGEIPTSMPWSAANRVSYCLDLCGPSLTVDTACSSSLVAIHLACESLNKGECAAAIAGGVNLYLHPAKYIQLCQHQMLSPSGRCHSFGAAADGFAPGEGVGVLVLRRMADAVRDNDRVLAAIRGTAVNHNGRTNGYTVPRSRSQAALVKSALGDGDVPPESITYVEAHGTGTKLGDPIEVMGLAEVLGGKDAGPCAIGSVKSNIGHLESAAGVAGVIKTILQMQHKSIAPSLHSEQLNPALELETTRFFVPQAVQAWEANGERPRRAGVSSFGAGGTNGHLVLEEVPDAAECAATTGPMVFPLSARTRPSLDGAVKALLACIEDPDVEQLPQFLQRLAYTLQCGRRHFEHRLAFVANAPVALAAQIRSQMVDASGNTSERAPYRGHVIEPEGPAAESDGLSHDALAKLWASGGNVRWQRHWNPQTPIPIVAPLYVFDEERHWLADARAPEPAPKKTVGSGSMRETILQVPASSSVFQHHQIGGRPLLPATAYIAHVHAAVSNVGVVTELSDLAWLRPISVGEAAHVSIVCAAREQGETVKFELCRAGDSSPCFSGLAQVASVIAPASANSLNEARTRCREALEIDDCYRKFSHARMEYGPRFRCLDRVWLGQGEVLARIVARDKARVGDVMTPLDPAMMDAALHAANFLIGDLNTPLVPIGAKRVVIYTPPSSEAFSVVRRRTAEADGEIRFDVCIYAPDGTLLIEIEEFRFRHLEQQQRNDLAEMHGLVTLRPDWIEVEKAPLRSAACSNLLFGINHDGWEQLRAFAPDAVAATRPVMDGTSFEVRDGSISWNESQQGHSELLWRALTASGSLPDRLMFLIDAQADYAFAKDGFESPFPKGSALEAIEIIRGFCQHARSHCVHVSVILQSAVHEVCGLGQAVSGLLRSLRLELPTLSASVVEIGDENWLPAVAEELSGGPVPGVREFRRESGHCFERRMVLADPVRAVPEFSKKDVVVVTGAAGAIGRRLSRLLASNGVGSLALISRSSSDNGIESLLKELRQCGARAHHWQADCADEQALAIAIADISRRLGPITGVLHCAGVLDDGFFVRQTSENLRISCRAKIQGAHWLDELTCDAPLKWFVVCSALAGIRGNVGQSHYALANTWLDRFVEHRELKVSRSARRGKSISIAWPFWATRDGMQASPRLVAALKKAGVAPIDDADGEEIFLRALGGVSSVLVPLKGEHAAIARFLDHDDSNTPGSDAQSAQGATPVAETRPSARTVSRLIPDPADSGHIELLLLDFLAFAFQKVTGADPSRIDPDAPMEVFGLDSLMVMELNAIIEQRFSAVSKTVAFEARSLRGLARMLSREHAVEAAKLAGPAPAKDPALLVDPGRQEIDAAGMSQDVAAGGVRATDIAIVGLAGQYPGGRTLHEFWSNLAAGRDLVGGLPNRWRNAPFGFGTADQDQRLYARWGSFLEDFDKFDPLFFGISPRDAERMDPQERLFLQTAWHAVEDAGYTPETLAGSRDHEDDRRRVGVVVGVMYGEYQFYGAAADASVPLTSSSYASIANRVSFCLDLDGPSFAVDSMCSSSLYAIHLACDLIRSGGCELAIAGGVNLSLHPYKYRTLCELNFASTDGKCRSFGEGGDGYVPGEGVGAVVLKPAQAAIRDKDHIYALIRGSDIGHGGRGSGYTVPNAEAQADVIRRAFLRSGVHQGRLSYIEAHGTGTSLGDPIELRGLGKALTELDATGHRCAIGSVKSNIGHLESAAGIAGLTKVLLQLKHQQIAPSLHAAQLNKNIDFASTPFEVQTELSDWGASNGSPRLAALSSFGAGGSNAHLVIEEYCAPAEVTASSNEDQIFVFSARTWKQLAATLAQFARHLEIEQISRDAQGSTLGKQRYRPAEVASTLLYGRRASRCRCAILAADFTALRESIKVCRARLERVEELAMDGPVESAFFGEAMLQVPTDMAAASPRERAQAWVNGQWVPSQPATVAVRKVPLPGYAFERNSYWVWDLTEVSGNEVRRASKGQVVDLLSRPSILTPTAIIETVERGEMDVADAETLLQRLIEAEAAE